MISRLLMSSLLLVAGILHLIRPELFNPAIPFAWKMEINVFAGVLELLLGIGLWTRALRDLTAQITALWFLFLIPVHLYVSYFSIPMFGVSDPMGLWGRTLFQPVLFFWALSLQDKGWIMSQRWTDVVFLHYEVDPNELQAKVPFPLDLYEGKGIVSIVPFVMGLIRFPFLPPIPGLSSLLELNLRTYVKVNGQSAVYFFTLDSNHLPGVLIARWFFALPYRWVQLRFSHKDDYHFKSPQLELKGRVKEAQLEDNFTTWATERYALLTNRGRKNLIGEVLHPPWSLQEFEVLIIKDEFSVLLGEELRVKSFRAVSYAQELDVRFKPFRKF